MGEPSERCEHLRALERVIVGPEHVCVECVKIGSRWVHLRTCQSCGVTLCCDSSPHRHMTAHNGATGHPVVASAQPAERWLWCYPDEVLATY
jgi:hypothetical protein